MKIKYHFLFGSEACTLYVQNRYKELLENIKAGEVDYNLFVFIEGETSPVILLMAYNGWSDYSLISEEEYNQIISLKIK